MWEVEYGAEYVTDKLLRRRYSCSCMRFYKTFYKDHLVKSQWQLKKEYKTMKKKQDHFRLLSV